MLYDWTGKEIDTSSSGKPPGYLAERMVLWEPADRMNVDESRALSPQKLDAILRDANAGDPRAQARLAAEIEEKDWDAGSALSVRTSAVKGLKLRFAPQQGMEKDRLAVKIAEQANEVLLAPAEHLGDDDDDIVGMDGLVQHCMGATLAGYAVMEILWGAAGRYVTGYAPIDTDRVTFTQSRRPLLYSSNHTAGLPLAPNKFVWHRHQSRSGDATRGGLIRPLGWMFLFENYGVKNLMRFVEKFGMPFVTAKVEDHAWETERKKIVQLIKNFGTDGGGVFSKAIELEFTEAAAGGGDIYFKLLEYFERTKTKVILGQTATSGDASGFSNGGAQSLVRQDILESDCAQVASTIRTSVARPWTMFNYGEDAPVPAVIFDCEAPEDKKNKSTVMVDLYNAGFEADSEDEMSAIYGVRLRRRPPQQNSFAMRGEAAPLHKRRTTVAEALQASEKVAEAALAAMTKDRAVIGAMLDPVADAIAEALSAAEGDEASFIKRVGALLEAIPGLADKMNAKPFESAIADAYRAARSNGMIAGVPQ